MDKDIQQPSLCMPERTFSLTYLYCERQITSNMATFVFSLSPPESKLSELNLALCLKFSFPSTIVSY